MKNKFLNKFTALALVACMSLSTFAVASAANTNNKEKTETVTTQKEVKTQNNVGLEIVTESTKKFVRTTVNITENTANFKDLQLKLEFKKESLKWIKNEEGNTGLQLLFNKDPNKGGILNVVASKDDGYNGKGTIFTAEFERKDKENAVVSFVKEKCMTDVDANVSFASSVKEPEGKWESVGNKWKFKYTNGSYASGEFQTIEGQTYYFDEDEYMVTGWKALDGKWYYFNGSGHMKKGWFYAGGNWFYSDPETGVMKTGWQFIDGSWYYMNSSGHMKTGWVYAGGNWFYMNGSGVMQTGWVYVSGNWYFMNSSGHMKTGWVYTGGNWFYMNGSGVMKTGWVYAGGNWFYMNSSGHMKTGWVYVDGKWYYMNSSGYMQKGWVKVGSDWYYFYSDGHMAKNTTVGGYRLGSSGAML